jgi:large subunit ribosomal protein L3
MRVDAKPEELNPKGGFLRYGVLNQPCMLLLGSVGGCEKRAITLTHALRPDHNTPRTAPEITHTSVVSKQ